MAKKKNKKGSSAAKSTKLPKELRKPLGIALELAQSPMAREIAASLLVAAASALVTRREDKDGASRPKAGEGDPSRLKPKSDPGKAGGEIAELVVQGIAAFVGNLGKTAHASGHDSPGQNETPPRPKPKLVP
ncbi:hypothetical protein [Sphingomonas sp.]|uniref:hypothetical protein n=1 Tax=Sphingomonas sp. TaxID=28214 RepID=UPI003B3B6D33